MAVVANLTALARACGPIVAGSVTSSSEVRKRMMALARFRLFARGLEGFAPLAERSGYAIAESRTAVVSEQVLLRPRATLAMTSPRCGSRANSIKLGSVHRSSPRPKSGLPDLRFRVRCLLRVIFDRDEARIRPRHFGCAPKADAKLGYWRLPRPTVAG